MLWVDLEMTGLNPQKDVILEIASIVTDYDMNVLDKFQAVVKHDSVVVNDLMDDFVKEMHQSSGLLDNLKAGKSLEEVENDFVTFLFRNFPTSEFEKIVMAGNSIQVDREFLIAHMPKVAESIHYRIVDVSSIRMIFLCKYDKVYKKDPSSHHQALADIMSSIDELKYYLGFVKL